MEAVSRRRRHEPGRVGQPGEEQTHAAEVEDGVGPAEGIGQDTARCGCRQVTVGDDDDEGQLGAERQRRVHGAALHGGGGDQAAERAGRGILGMPVVGRRHGKGVVRARGSCRRGGEGGRRAEPTRQGDL